METTEETGHQGDNIVNGHSGDKDYNNTNNNEVDLDIEEPENADKEKHCNGHVTYKNTESQLSEDTKNDNREPKSLARNTADILEDPREKLLNESLPIPDNCNEPHNGSFAEDNDNNSARDKNNGTQLIPDNDNEPRSASSKANEVQSSTDNENELHSASDDNHTVSDKDNEPQRNLNVEIVNDVDEDDVIDLENYLLSQCIKAEVEDDIDYEGNNFMDFAMTFIEKEAVVLIERKNIYQCTKCTRGFLTQRDLRLHTIKHINQEVIKESRKRKIELIYPTDKRFVKNHQCPECEESFVQETTLKTHMTIHKPFPFICHCGIGYYLQKNLTAHQELIHPDMKQEKVWKPKIKLKPKLPDELKPPKPKSKVQYRHTSEESSISSDEGYTDLSYLSMYNKNIKPRLRAELRFAAYPTPRKKSKKKKKSVTRPKAPIGTLTCPVCDIVSKNKFRHMQHLRSHTGEKPFACDECNKAYTTAHALKTHKNMDHLGIKEFVCSFCDKAIRSKAQLIIHLRVHTKDKPFRCEICDKKFSQSGALKLHMDRHAGKKEYACSFCNKRFDIKCSRDNHELIHMDSKPFVCKYCEKGFNDRSAMARHERTHTGEKPYKCEYCPSKFSDCSALIQHRLRHTGKKDFKCEHCGKEFYNRDSLRKHEMRVHSGEKNFTCDLCNKSYAVKSTLQYHIKWDHLSEPIACNICKRKYRNKHMLTQHMESAHSVKQRSSRNKVKKIELSKN